MNKYNNSPALVNHRAIDFIENIWYYDHAYWRLSVHGSWYVH